MERTAPSLFDKQAASVYVDEAKSSAHDVAPEKACTTACKTDHSIHAD